MPIIYTAIQYDYRIFNFFMQLPDYLVYRTLIVITLKPLTNKNCLN